MKKNSKVQIKRHQMKKNPKVQIGKHQMRKNTKVQKAKSRAQKNKVQILKLLTLEFGLGFIWYFFGYLATLTALFSLITVTFIWPG